MFNGKEISPEITVHHAKRILQRCGISIKEIWFDSDIQNIYSVRIEIDGTEYGTNGKGSTKEFALASAYGELMERLGNGAIFKNGERQLTNSLFTYFPDEFDKTKTYFETTSNNPIICLALKNLSDDYLIAYKKWISLVNSEYIKCVEYKAETSNSCQIVPIKLLKMYGSNGMAAGNSKEEAFVQAVSEIFERYSVDKILNENLSPPVIPLSYIEKEYGRIYSIVNEIQQQSDLTVEFRDCSLNLEFPVVCVCIYNKKRHTDSISFGAHPMMEIALERALTEAFQGRNVNKITNCVYLRNRDVRYNRFSILKNGTGYFPYSFYSKESSYRFVPLNSNHFVDNAEMKQYIVNLCKKNNIEIYTHSMSLYNFFVIHVIIPGISEIIKYDEFHLKTDFMIKFLSKVSDLRCLSDQEHQASLEFIDYSRKNPELWSNFSKHLIRVQDDKKIEETLLTSLLCGFYHLGEYDRAIHYNALLKPYIDTDYHSGISIILDMKRRNHNNQEIRSFMSYYYFPEIINQIFIFIENGELNPLYDGVNSPIVDALWLNSVTKLKEGVRTI